MQYAIELIADRIETHDGHLDYWERLKHRYFGMLMQGLMANPSNTPDDYGELVNHALDMSEDMVLAMKEESYGN